MPSDAYLVCGGKYHDMDYARLELLRLLAEHEDVRTKVAQDYRDSEAIAASDFLVTYTCDVRPSEAEQRVLRDFVEGGRRWLALHGTNSVLDFDGRPPFQTPRSHPMLMETLGSQFLAHPGRRAALGDVPKDAGTGGRPLSHPRSLPRPL